MPIYEYRCSRCLHQFEVRQNFDDEALTLCPACQGEARRIIHPAPVIFKGTGFYATDNRKPDSSIGKLQDVVKGKEKEEAKEK